MHNRLIGRAPRAKYWLLAGSLASSAVFVILLCCAFNPRWAANDDVGMLMVAHGFGIAAVGSPTLVFSNVLWGYLVRLIPEIHGILGYSVATLSVLVVVGAVCLYGLLRLGVSYTSCLAAIALILVRAVLFPDFTVNAGLLMVAAVVCLRLYAQNDDLRTLSIGCVLAYLSYLVRKEEFLLVLVVSLPLLLQRTTFSRKPAKVLILILVSLITVSAIIDHETYRQGEWTASNEIRQAASPFVDFRAGPHLKEHPEILKKYGYSANDINLISNWFFVDPQVANPRRLESMFHDVGPLPTESNLVVNAWSGVTPLWDPKLRPLLLAALILIALYPTWQGLSSWALCLAAVFVFGLFGRPGVLRVYVPLMTLFVFVPLLVTNDSVWRRRTAASVLLAACLFNSSSVFMDSKASQFAIRRINKALVDFPTTAVINWGAAFPFEEVYPVLAISSTARSYKLYSLGAFTLAPFSLAMAEQRAGRGMVERLTSEQGIPIIADGSSFNLLAVYCQEHLHGTLLELAVQKYGDVVLSTRRCEIER